MALDSELLDAAEALREPGMGTEGVGPLLYSLIRMARPRSALEVGIGYTSIFIAKALADAAAEHAADRALLADPNSQDRRKPLLIPPYYQLPYAPKLYAIDDYSAENATARQTLEVLEAQGLRGIVELHEGDFRGYSAKLPAEARPLDFVWFDCGGPQEYQAFFEEYWPLINPNHGLVALHFTYWSLPMEFQGRSGRAMQPSAILNELKRQQIAAGENAGFEVLSLLEPHKQRQGSVTLLRRLAPTSRQRAASFDEEMTAAGFDPGGGFRALADLQQLLRQGLALHRQGQLQPAEALYRQALQSQPDAPEALNLLGALLAQQGGAKLAEGISCLQQAAQAAPRRGDIQLNLGHALRMAGAGDAALAAFAAARRGLPPPQAEQALLAEGGLLEQLGRAEEAIALYHSAPPSPGLLFNLASALNRAGRLDDAEAALTQALTQAPGFAQAWGNLAGIRLKRGRIEQAVSAYREGLAAAPGEPLLHLGLGNALYRARDHAGAVEAFRAALARKPALANAHAGLVNALANAGRTEEALAAAEAAANLPDPPPRLLAELSGILAGLGRAEEALATAEKALERAPHEVRALSRLAPLLRAAGRRDEAEGLFSPAKVLRTRQLTEVPGWDSLAAFNRDLAAGIRARPDHTAEAPDAATKGGSQTAELFGDPAPAVQALKALLETEVEAALATYAADPPAPYFAAPPRDWRLISNAVVLRSEGYQDPHVHINGYLSGVYYVEIPEIVARGNGEEGCLYVADSQEEEGRSLREIVRPQQGLMVLFPSYLWHGTVPYRSDSERICVAFDLVAEGAGEVRTAGV